MRDTVLCPPHTSSHWTFTTIFKIYHISLAQYLFQHCSLKHDHLLPVPLQQLRFWSPSFHFCSLKVSIQNDLFKMCRINSAHCIKSLDYFPLQLEHTPSELIHHGPRRSLSQLLWPYCFSNMLGLLPAQGFTFRVLCLGNSLPQDIFWLVSFCYLGLCSNVTFSERISLTTPPWNHTHTRFLH